EDSKSRIWVSTRRGVAYFENGRFIPVASVPGGVHSIAGDRSGNLWLSQNDHLFHLRDGTVIERIPWAALGREDHARHLTADPARGGLWLGFKDGLSYFEGGGIRASYSVADGLADGRIRVLRIDREGIVWVSSQGGLSRL